MSEVRAQLVGDLYRVVVPVGITAILAGWFRNIRADIGHRPDLLFVVAGVLVLAWIFQRKIHWRCRGALIIAGLILSAFQSMLYLGVAAPGSFLLATSVILAWMTLGSIAAWITAAMSGFVLGYCALRFLGGSASSILERLDPNLLPMFWIQLAIVQTLVAALILTIIRRLVRSNVERQEKIAEEKDRVAGILEAIQEALFVHELPDGRIVQANRRAEEMFQLTQEQLLGSLPYEFSANIPPWTAVEGNTFVQKALTEGPQQFVWRSRKGDGSLFWSEIAVRKFLMGEKPCLLVTIRDIEERVRDKIELQKLNTELEARVARRTAAIEQSRQDMQAFSYAVSHDLRAPLRAIDGFTRVLSEDFSENLPGDGQAALGRILAGADRMNRLIDALLDLSRIDRKPVRRITVDMDRLVQELVEEIEASKDELRPAIEWNLEPLPPSLSDPDLVRQVWANLLSNAVKFCQASESPAITVRAESRPDGTWYVVSDNGEGFDMSHAKKLFGMFQRLHGSAVEGLGIGLATVKRILNRLDGDIEFEAEPNRGATFRFRPRPSEFDETALELASQD